MISALTPLLKAADVSMDCLTMLIIFIMIVLIMFIMEYRFFTTWKPDVITYKTPPAINLTSFFLVLGAIMIMINGFFVIALGYEEMIMPGTESVEDIPGGYVYLIYVVTNAIMPWYFITYDIALDGMDLAPAVYGSIFVFWGFFLLAVAFNLFKLKNRARKILMGVLVLNAVFGAYNYYLEPEYDRLAPMIMVLMLIYLTLAWVVDSFQEKRVDEMGKLKVGKYQMFGRESEKKTWSDIVTEKEKKKTTMDRRSEVQNKEEALPDTRGGYMELLTTSKKTQRPDMAGRSFVHIKEEDEETKEEEVIEDLIIHHEHKQKLPEEGPHMDMVECGFCMAIVPMDDSCEACGTDLNDAGYRQMMKCPNCKEFMGRNDKICHRCGYQIHGTNLPEKEEE